MNTTVICLVKFFQKEEYADSFLNGNLHLNRLSYFIDLEKKGSGVDLVRPDKYEGVIQLLQPNSDLNMILSVPKLGITHVLHGNQMAGPLSMTSDYVTNMHVFCMYALKTTYEYNEKGEFNIPDSELEKLQKELMIDERNFQFGEFAVITSGKHFIDKLDEYSSRNKTDIRYSTVKYYDENTFNGDIHEEYAIFYKQKRFEYQNEFRIRINTKTNGKNPLNINIGDISKFSKKIKSSEINNHFKLKKSVI